MFEKLHIKITILAALISTIYCIIFSQSFTKSCFTIIITISVFYTISGFISMSLRKYTEELEKKRENLQDLNEVEFEEEDTSSEEEQDLEEASQESTLIG